MDFIKTQAALLPLKLRMLDGRKRRQVHCSTRNDWFTDLQYQELLQMALAYSQEESSHCEMASRSSKGVKIYRASSFQVVFAIRRCPYKFLVLGAKHSLPKQRETVLRQSKLVGVQTKDEDTNSEYDVKLQESRQSGEINYQSCPVTRNVLVATVAPLSTDKSTAVQDLLAVCGTGGKGNHQRAANTVSISSYFKPDDKHLKPINEGSPSIAVHPPLLKKPNPKYQRAKQTKVKALLSRSISRARKSPFRAHNRRLSSKLPTRLFDKCRYSRKKPQLLKTKSFQELKCSKSTLGELVSTSIDHCHDVADNDDGGQVNNNSVTPPHTICLCSPIPTITTKKISLSQEVTPEQQDESREQISSLSPTYLAANVNTVKRQLRKIAEGQEYCKRHEDYKKGGKARRNLMFQVNLSRFSEEQQQAVAMSLLKIFCATSGRHFNYVMDVLLPEALILLQIECLKFSREEAEANVAVP